MPKPYITALIDTYNQGRFVEEAIESVLAQDFPMSEVEIIVVDDGSTDDTPERIRRFAGRIRYLRKPNGGQASALNAGFAAATGQIIAFLDGDDTWRLDKLAKVAQALEAQPSAVLCYHPMVYVNERVGQVLSHSGFNAISGDVLSCLEKTLLYGSISTSSMALRREFVAPIFPIPKSMRIYADSYLAYLAIFLGPVVAVPDALTLYRMHETNLASLKQPSPEKLAQRAHSFENARQAMHAWLCDHNVQITSEGRVFLKRQELVSAMLAHAYQPPSRKAYAAYWREFNRLYAPVWSRSYRAFRILIPLAARVLGYQGFASLQRAYAGSFVVRIRGQWLAARKNNAESRWPKAQPAST